MNLHFNFEEREFTVKNCEVVPTLGQPNAGRGAAILAALVKLAAAAPGAEDPAVLGLSMAQLQLSALLDIYHGMPGLLARTPTKVVQIYTNFAEVHSPKVLSDETLGMRLAFARQTGYLVIGPDEALSVVLDLPPAGVVNEPSSLSVDAQCTPEGVLRIVYGIYPHALEWHMKLRSIAGLDKISAKDEWEKALAQHLRHTKSSNFTPTEHERSRKACMFLAAYQDKAPHALTESGAIKTTWFIESGSTSAIARLTSAADGWIDYNTCEDAWYFGIYVNPKKRELLHYCEGDVAHVYCANDMQFSAELAQLAKFYAGGRKPSGYNVNKRESASFEALAFDHLREGFRLVFRSDVDKPVWDGSNWNTPLQAMIQVPADMLHRMSADSTVSLTEEEFCLDLYNPLAFQPCAATLTRSIDGAFEVKVVINGTVYTAAFQAFSTAGAAA